MSLCNDEKIIWAFWDTGEHNAPTHIKYCLNSWRNQNPSWVVEVLDLKSLKSFLNLEEIIGKDYEKVPVQALSDIIRINLLSKYGGVWVDSTCVCKKPLDYWLPSLLSHSGFFAFHKPGPDRELASWFLASTKSCMLPKRWARHVNSLWKGFKNDIEIVHNMIGRKREKPWMDKKFWHKPKQLPYFWFHYSFAYLLPVAPRLEKVWRRTPKFTADIPHFFALGKYPRKDISVMNSEWEHGISPLYKTSYYNIRPEEGLENPMLFIQSKLKASYFQSNGKA